MPTPSELHVDAVLSDVANSYSNEQFIAPTLFPVVPVKKQSDKYAIYGKERFKHVDTRRAPGAEARQITWAVSWGDYGCEGYALSDVITEEERDNADAIFDLEADGTELITELLYVDWEKRVRDLLMDTGAWTNAPASQVWTHADADPVADIRTGIDAIKYANPNTIVLGKDDWNAFCRCPAVTAYLGSNERKLITPEIAASITGIPNWKIGAAWWDTAKRGKTESLTRIWGDNVWLGYIAPRPGRRVLTAGLTFRWKTMQTQRDDDRRRHSTWLEVSYNQDEAVVCSEVGYVITNTAA